MQIKEIMFLLIRSAVCGYELDPTELADLKAALSAEGASEELYKLSKKHDLAHIISAGLEKYDVLDMGDPYLHKFAKQQFTAVYRYEKLNYELGVLTQALEEGGIDHIPLKGSVIRDMYPEAWMRTSCDIDVLVKPEDLEKAAEYLVEKLGYERKAQSSHDISMFSAGGVHIELHYELVEDGIVNSVAAVLDNAWQMAYAADGKKYAYRFDDEMFYFYHVSHMAKHFVHGGCGIRPFIDLWILDRDRSNQRAREKLLVSGELLRFCESARELYGVWFDGKDHTERTAKMQEYLLTGGVYGTMENLTLMQNRKKGNKFKYVWQRIFMPYDQIKYGYPILQKHKWLLPFYWVVRWFKLLRRDTAKRVAREVRITGEISKDDVSAMDSFLCDIGLK